MTLFSRRRFRCFPDWLKLVATSRAKTNVVDAFGDAAILRLDCADARNRRDILMLINRLLAPTARGGATRRRHLRCPQPRGALLDIIDAKAEGNALCATQLALAVRRSGMDAASIATLPRGLSALFLAILQRRFDPQGADWTIVRELLEMILATRAALPVELAAKAGGDRVQYATRRAVESISDLLNVHDDEVRLFHQTLVDFLRQPDTPFFSKGSFDERGNKVR